ncbi:MAG: hypothetical protein ACD_10C00481G0001 [uncultured bacterium]|nr:MAG: hypothetical protein ACD_10C00481G0001 [uncultured bacterium]
MEGHVRLPLPHGTRRRIDDAGVFGEVDNFPVPLLVFLKRFSRLRRGQVEHGFDFGIREQMLAALHLQFMRRPANEVKQCIVQVAAHGFEDLTQPLAVERNGAIHLAHRVAEVDSPL